MKEQEDKKRRSILDDLAMAEAADGLYELDYSLNKKLPPQELAMQPWFQKLEAMVNDVTGDTWNFSAEDQVALCTIRMKLIEAAYLESPKTGSEIIHGNDEYLIGERGRIARKAIQNKIDLNAEEFRKPK